MKVTDMTRSQRRRWGIKQQNKSTKFQKLNVLIAERLKKEAADDAASKK